MSVVTPFSPLEAARLARAKRAYTTGRVDLSRASRLLAGPVHPHAGDLVLARVESLGQHRRIELPTGRRAHLHPGDEIVVCFGRRYAPDQFEAELPESLGQCHLVAAGGIAATMVNKHRSMKRPTGIRTLGILTDDDGRRLNLSDFALRSHSQPARRPPVVAVVGTSMNAGKTTTAAALVRGMVSNGVRVGAIKVTGTGAGGDVWMFHDSGAEQVYDFTAVGHPSTLGLELEQVEQVVETLIAQLAADGVEAIVMEVADGLFQRETAALLRSPVFRRSIDKLVFAAGDAMGAVAGAAHLLAYRLPLVAVSGALTQSPMSTREAASVIEAPVVPVAELERLDWRNLMPLAWTRMEMHPRSSARHPEPAARRLALGEMEG